MYLLLNMPCLLEKIMLLAFYFCWTVSFYRLLGDFKERLFRWLVQSYSLFPTVMMDHNLKEGRGEGKKTQLHWGIWNCEEPREAGRSSSSLPPVHYYHHCYITQEAIHPLVITFLLYQSVGCFSLCPFGTRVAS